MAFKEFLVIFGFIQLSLGASKLGSYNVDPKSLTVSGISSGGAMSSQFHFIYSSEVKGAGIFAAGPYLCGFGGLTFATSCMASPNSQNVQSFINRANTFSTTGNIDPVSNLNNSKVYIFHGSKDTVVNQGSGKNLKLMYDNYKANVKAEFSIAAGHGMPVDRNGYGGACSSLNPMDKFINDCGYSGAYEMFKWFHGDNDNITKPEPGYKAPSSQLFTFDQSEFFTPSALISLAQSGLIYVPTGCMNKSEAIPACRLHIAFHGCASNQQTVGTDYATKTQYMEVAELNNILVLFPQTSSPLINPSGCWDWMGYTGFTTFGTKSGPQPVAVYKMMKRVMGA